MTKAAEELRTLEVNDIETRLTEARKELFNLRFQLATGRLDNFGRIAVVRRDIARILTLQQEREAGFMPAPRPRTPRRASVEKSSEKATAKSNEKETEKEEDES